jgi:hypothetical protein
LRAEFDGLDDNIRSIGSGAFRRLTADAREIIVITGSGSSASGPIATRLV